MKIAVCSINADVLGGAQKLAALLASSLQKNRFEVACISLRPPKKGKSFPEFFEIEKWYTPKQFIPENFGNLETLFYQNYLLLPKQLQKCEKEFKPDVFISLLWAGPEVFKNVKAPKILYVHFASDVFLSSKQPRRLLHTPVLKAHYQGLKEIDKIVYSSNFVKEIAYNSWNRYLTEHKFEVIYPCIKWGSFQKNNSTHRKQQVCYVGRIIEDKGIEIVVDAFLKANIKDSELVVAGNFTSYKKTHVPLRDKLLSLANRGIRLIENPTDEEIVDVYNSSMAFANFCPSETFGMCVVEAMASGTPPIVADGGGQKETVIHGVTGFRINPTANNVSDEMANYMKLLLANKEVFEAMSKQVTIHAKQFDESIFVAKWIEILKTFQ
jgi:glycosyltransferase involved in cell wall biosynthesis